MPTQHQQPEDFLTDDSFINWTKHLNKKDEEEWNEWIKQHPQSMSLINEALALLEALSVKENLPEPGKVQMAKEKLFQFLDEKPATVMRTRRWLWPAAAAAIITIIIFAGYLFVQQHAVVTMQTQYGQLNNKTLPDGSEIILNANSHIEYNNNWKKDKQREVWIDGEAFFHVAKTKEKTTFIVHAKRFDVIVTGTQFNIKNRDGKSSVLLTEGSITLKTSDGKEINMKPGDYIEISNNDEHIHIQNIKAENITAWKEHKLIFENTLLKDALKEINEQYGVTIKTTNDAVANKTITAILPNNNLNELLHALETTGDFTITKDANEIIVGEH